MYYITVSNGLLKNGHRQKMGAAVWEFMWLLDKMTDAIDGKILGGKPIRLSEIAKDLESSERTAGTNLKTLKKHGYITIVRTPHGLSVRVSKPKKIFQSNKAKEIDAIMERIDARMKSTYDNRRKNNHWNWKGGITPLRDEIRNLKEYKDWRSEVLKMCEYACQLCGVGGNLEVDHFPVPFANMIQVHRIDSVEKAVKTTEFWDIKNGRALCTTCHKEVTFGSDTKKPSDDLTSDMKVSSDVSDTKKPSDVIDNTALDNTIDNTISSNAPALRKDQDVFDVIEAFNWNPAYTRFFKNKTQREAAKNLLKICPQEKLGNFIKNLPKVNTQKYIAKSTTPLELLNNWSKLEAYYKSETKREILQA